MNVDLFSSKTMKLWIVIMIIAFVAFLISLGVAVAFNRDPFALLTALYSLLGGGGLSGTARNVISDGVMPRVPQYAAAKVDPNVALQAPTTLRHSEGPFATPNTAVHTDINFTERPPL